ncbi:MAG TPA: hypothetical protein VEO53_02665 [Candidatus Binatia bacterium]|nr:hypothetical protein [Candidatus Binatia bacterium]
MNMILQNAPDKIGERSGFGQPDFLTARQAQGEFKNHRKSRSRRGNEAEVFFAPKSASYSENEVK